MHQLRGKALIALEEALEESRITLIRRTWSLRFALAFLSNFADDREPFDEFWRALTEPNQLARYASANAALNRIYRTIRVNRDHELSLRLRTLRRRSTTPPS
jgi:hypothetical protein